MQAVGILWGKDDASTIFAYSGIDWVRNELGLANICAVGFTC